MRMVFSWIFAAFSAFAAPVGADRCSVCHSQEVQQYARTGMAHSLSLPAGPLAGTFTHAESQTTFDVKSANSGMIQAARRGGVRAEYPVAYVMGSGNHAFAYLVRIGDYLFQSPISYYTKRQVWDMAPGFEHDRTPDFTRPVTPDCLLCHTGSSFPVDGINKYQAPYIGSMAISCDRCHGPVEAHLRAPSRANIINPARLAPPARDSVCEQCHFTGEARIANPGKSLSDFQVGQGLESTYSVYVFDEPPASGSTAAIKVVSHAEQLRRSMCARQSGGRLWCGTCHDPHNVPDDKKSFYRARCLSCHGEQLVATHPKPSEDCIGCQMPLRPAKDGGHTAFTDHQIVRKQEGSAVEPSRERPSSLARSSGRRDPKKSRSGLSGRR